MVLLWTREREGREAKESLSRLRKKEAKLNWGLAREERGILNEILKGG